MGAQGFSPRRRKLLAAFEASAASTRRAYRAAWVDFTDWSAAASHSPLPAVPEVVGSFLAERASLNMRLVAIGQAHRLAGHRLDAQHPAIRETMKGISRTYGTAATKKNAAITDIIRDGFATSAARAGVSEARCKPPAAPPMKYPQAGRPATAGAEYWLSQDEPVVALPRGTGDFANTPRGLRTGFHNAARGLYRRDA